MPVYAPHAREVSVETLRASLFTGGGQLRDRFSGVRGFAFHMGTGANRKCCGAEKPAVHVPDSWSIRQLLRISKGRHAMILSANAITE